MRAITIIAAALLLTATTAQAKCIRTPQGDNWRYRFVDGHRCWHAPGDRVAKHYHKDDDSDRSKRRKHGARHRPYHPPARKPAPQTTPIEEITQSSEPEPPSLPTAPAFMMKPPPSPWQYIQDVFDGLVARCQENVELCTGLK
jgi:hypothetical protein